MRLPRVPLQKLIALVSIGTFFCAAGLRIEASAPNEYAVKAAYLYNFGRFVQWPATAKNNSGGSFAICVLGMDPFGRVLDGIIAGQTIDGMNVVARRVSRPEDATGCRILFISSSEAGALTRILAALGNASILTVSSIPQFTQSGGMIRFVLKDDRVRFEVNRAATRRAGIKLSSQLLKLAVHVINGVPSGG